MTLALYNELKSLGYDPAEFVGRTEAMIRWFISQVKLSNHFRAVARVRNAPAVKSLLSAPPMLSVRPEGAAHEAAHVVALLGQNFDVVDATPRYVTPERPYPTGQAAAIVAVAGAIGATMLCHPGAPPLSVKSWNDAALKLSDEDRKWLEAAGLNDTWDRPVELAGIYAVSILNEHHAALKRIWAGLQRNWKLTGHQCEMLFHAEDEPEPHSWPRLAGLSI